MVVGSRSNQKVVSEVAANFLMVDQKPKIQCVVAFSFFFPLFTFESPGRLIGLL